MQAAAARGGAFTSMAVAVLKTETVRPEQTRRRRPSAEKAGGAETTLWPPVIMAAAARGSRVLGLGVGMRRRRWLDEGFWAFPGGSNGLADRRQRNRV
jgi:hypothetical protein